MTVLTIMKLVYCLLLVWIISNVLSEARKVNVGCNLIVPDAVKEQMEATGYNGSPLLISVDIKVLDVRDVPDIGGSYGVDLR